jgi:hypothetical protein
MKRSPNTLLIYILIVASNALPVYGALIGKLFFFQVIYLYWFESLLLILFDCIRIGAARGTGMDGDTFGIIAKGGIRVGSQPVGLWERIGLILRTLIVRTLLLAFYLLFILLFIMLQVTGKEHMMEVAMTIAFRNAFFNTAVGLFIISNLVQLIGPFFINGQYRQMSPHNYASIMDGRTIMLHVMIAFGVFIHKFLFEGTSYVALGEVVYVGIFMLIKTVLDILHARKQQAAEAEAMPMI